MKKHLTAITAVAAVLGACTAQAAPRITWLEDAHNFGAFDETLGVVSCRMRYVNTGDEPLVVIAARASCGCTTPAFERTPLAPGDTAAITVTYDPAGRPGRFNKKITIDTNTEPQRSTLHISGVVIGAPATVAARFPVDMGPLKLTSPAALLGTTKKGHVRSVFIDGYNRSTDSIRPQVSGTPAWLEVTAGPPVVPPGERVSFNFFIRPDRTPLYGFVSDSVTFVPDPANPAQSFTMPVVATFDEDFSALTADDYRRAPAAELSAETIELPATPAGQSVTINFAIRNTGRSPLLVRRIYSGDSGVTIGRYKANIKPGKSVTVPLTVLASDRPRRISVAIITNDPITPTRSITITQP